VNASDTLQNQIRSEHRPCCELCGNSGQYIHIDLADRLFAAPGHWNLKQCNNPKCRLVWLDPMPLKEDLGNAYSMYYTHQAPEVNKAIPKGFIRQAYRQLKMSYLADRYHYETGVSELFARSMGKLLYLFPLRRREVDSFVRRLSWVPKGKLLDVGCGSGLWLILMRELGWEVEGVDFDGASVNLAVEQGLKVHQGSLEQQTFSCSSFDAITLNHVIEHVPDPVQILSECARILKPGGQLIIATPNASAFGHRVFGKNWRGLEPPRHLYLFTPASMRSLLSQAGFHNARVGAYNSLFIWQESFRLWSQTRRGFLPRLIELIGPSIYVVFEACWLLAQPQAGEALLIEVMKN
jgi:2-polyprenyl-3-methyl-5-hydroxy-6-metoxy-1,4-benzoquinol methylase